MPAIPGRSSRKPAPAKTATSEPRAAEPTSQGDAGGVDLTPQLAEMLTRASWRLRRASVRELAPLGLTFVQARVLRMLDRAAEPVRIGEIAARLEVVPRSATTLIDSLETTKLVKRQADPEDRRSVRVGLTADGAALMRRVSSMRRESAAALFRRLTSAQREQLLELLTVLTERDQPTAGAEPALEELP